MLRIKEMADIQAREDQMVKMFAMVDMKNQVQG